MSAVENTLARVEEQLTKGHAKEPAKLLTELMTQMSPAEVRVWEQDYRALIDRFQPKHRKRLLLELKQALRDGLPSTPAVRPTPTSSQRLHSCGQFDIELTAILARLAADYPLEWATAYRDQLSPVFAKLFDLDREDCGDCVRILRQRLAEHSLKIFGRPYIQLRNRERTHADALMKPLSGLERFIELLIEFYSAVAPRVSDASSAKTIRATTSAALLGILEGFSSCRFGTELGSEVLARFAARWVAYSSFLTFSDASELLEGIEVPKDFEHMQTRLLATLKALDRLVAPDTRAVTLPAVSSADWAAKRLEIGLRQARTSSDPRLLQIVVFLDSRSVSANSIRLVSREPGVVAVVAPLRSDLRGEINIDRSDQARLVVDASDEKRLEDVSQEILDRVYADLYRGESPRAANAPLTYNVAKEFPLADRSKQLFYHVARTSVRDLLKSFERRNGVRLWCSVRRSGKTTACFHDLGSLEGTSVVVSQTCNTSDPTPRAHEFYDRVMLALSGGGQLDANFVVTAVAACADRAGRVVLVLDEYEVFFETLTAFVRERPLLEYSVVHPLLNQLLEFANDNLLVFLGQQPGAHFVFMKQSQLPAYVEQDAFPLFEHHKGTLTGEFSAFVQKVLTEHIAVSASFVDAVFDETGGHPFLTVNVLTELVDWLIAKRRTAKQGSLKKADFVEFSATRLNANVLRRSPSYDFFRYAIQEALGAPETWLGTVYRVLHVMGRDQGTTPELSFAEFDRMIEEDPVLNRVDVDSAEIMKTATMANFLAVTSTTVRPRIRILGRLAGVSRGGLPKTGSTKSA